MFQGDISNFSPADLLVFLAHLNKEGVLTIRRADENLCFSFRQGCLIDAHSGPVDRRIIDMLRHRDAVAADALQRVEQAQRETELPLLRILETVDDIPAADITAAMTAGLHEAVFRLFLWESGEFRFTEIAVDPNAYVAPVDCQAVTMDVSREVDEYREAMRTLGPEDQSLVLAPAGAGAEAADGAERYVLDHARGDRTLGQLLACGPFRTHELALAVAQVRNRGWLQLVPAEAGAAPAADADPAVPEFQVYRRALRSLLVAENLQAKVRELAAFCRDTCECTSLLAVTDGEVTRCRSYRKDAQGSMQQSDLSGPGVRLDMDPVFGRVGDSGLPFYGRVFASDLLATLGIEPPDGDCAIVPMGRGGSKQLLLYAAVARTDVVPGPLHYLELMGWHVQPPAAPAAAASAPADESAATPGPSPDAPATSTDPHEQSLQKMVASLRELPAMPDVVTAVLRQLATPDCPMSKLAETISRDPALVARLIKVSNSSLYGGGQTISSLNQALVRLGFRTIRSLVIAASSRALFPMNDTRVGLWGRSLWEHSVEVGVAAKRVAVAVGYSDPEEAFAAGVLHDIGKVVILLNRTEEYRAIEQAMAGGAGSREAETGVLGFDHCRVGEWLVEQWEMPAELAAGIVHHHDPAAAGDLETLARIVGCGDLLSHHLGTGAEAGEAWLDEELGAQLGQLGLAPEQLTGLSEAHDEEALLV